MSPSAARRFACLGLALVAWSATFTRASGSAPAGRDADATPQDAARAPAPIAASVCASCHQAIHRRWTGARHSRMLQPATPAAVAGRFSDGPIRLRGATFTLSRTGDQFFVRGPFPTSREEVHRVEFTLGSRRVQHYLARLADGRLVVLPPSWDVERREWFHNLDIVNPDQAAEHPVQVWNRSCVGCHVSGESKGFDPANATYDTHWTDFGTSCERCHGPAAAHVARYQAGRAPRGSDPAIVVPARLDPDRSTMVCAQCHSLRDITVPGFRAGADYFDHFTPVLEYAQPSGPDPPYWADGRPRRFSNDAVGLWQSRCYLEGGATCVTCHVDPHEPDVDRNPRLSRTNNALCAGCHGPIADAGSRHTRHSAESAGSSCIGCHMPRTVISLRSRMPDHTIGVPAPENTVRHGIPNACSECHQDKDPAWAVRVLNEWFPNGRRQRLAGRADAFTAARRRDPSAIDALVRLATDSNEPPLVRANAIGYLRLFPGARAETYLSAAASSEHAAVRLAAVLGLGAPGFSASNVTPILVHALGDERRVVRVGAALGLINLKTVALDGEAGAQFEEAKRDYLARGALLSDDPAVLLDVGKFHLMNRDPAAATDALQASLRLHAGMQASRYFLALALLAQGRAAEARDQLLGIPKSDAYAPDASRLLSTLPGGKRGGS